MEVILLSDVKSLGKKNQLVKVSDGYAKNFLFPKKLAVEANSVNKNLLEQHNAAEAHRKAEEKKLALEQKALLEKAVVTIKAKGSQAKLFGAVTSKEIATQIKNELGIDIDRKKMSVADIKSFGIYTAEIKLYTGIIAKLTVNVTE